MKRICRAWFPSPHSSLRRRGLSRTVLRVVGALVVLASVEEAHGAQAVSKAGPSGDVSSGSAIFTEIHVAAGLDYEHGYVAAALGNSQMMSGGVAAGDYDGDGLTDLYVVRGDIGPNLLFRNQGDGTFVEEGAAAGVDLTGMASCGPLFVDLDGDGRQDLFVGGVEGRPLRVFRNDGAGVDGVVTFSDVTAGSGFPYQHIIPLHSFSTAAGDADLDGDLDLFLSRWQFSHLQWMYWENQGDGTFVDAGATVVPVSPISHTLTPNFVDLNQDRWPDLLLTSDFGDSEVLINRGGVFSKETTPVITDENGMGAAVADFDNDGDYDWFVSSIWDPDGVAEGNWGITGNRLYRYERPVPGQGADWGRFTDVTDAAGVREGYWGWGSCAGDFDLDGDLDLVQVNGMQLFEQIGIAPEFQNDPTRFFVNDGTGSFTENAVASGIDDTGQGRGVVCFDLERDGDLDIFIANNSGPPKLFRNDLVGGSSLTVQVVGPSGNPQGVGARVEVRTASLGDQVREVRAGSNFTSQNPTEVHFGLGSATIADRVIVRGPGRHWAILHQVSADQVLSVTPAPPFFDDGFETGDFAAWSRAMP